MHSHNLQRRQRLLKAVSATCRPAPRRGGPRKDADLETGADRRKPAGREGICKADRKQGQERRSGFLPHHLRKPTLGQMGAPPAVTGGFSRCRLTATSSRLRLSLSASSSRTRRKSTEDGPSRSRSFAPENFAAGAQIGGMRKETESPSRAACSRSPRVEGLLSLCSAPEAPRGDSPMRPEPSFSSKKAASGGRGSIQSP